MSTFRCLRCAQDLNVGAQICPYCGCEPYSGGTPAFQQDPPKVNFFMGVMVFSGFASLVCGFYGVLLGIHNLQLAFWVLAGVSFLSGCLGYRQFYK